MDKKILWESTLAELQLNLSTANFQTWFKGKTTIVSLNGGFVEIGCNSSYIKNWIESRYQGQLKSILDRVTGENLNLAFTVDPFAKNTPKKGRHKKPTSTTQSQRLFEEPNQELLNESLSKARLNPSFTLNSFVVGKSNQLAYAVAKAISETPSKNYNPFFVYGGVGIGKTHLIQAIAQEALTKNPNLKIYYCGCEEFTNELVTSIQAKTTPSFRNKYRGADMLLLDDVQFLSGRESTQEEVFHTFNVLFASGKQIVIAGDRPPAAIGKLAERLKSRFEGGIVADIGKPEMELREAVVLQKCKAQNVTLPNQIIHLLAEHFQDNIRELEGGLVRLLTYSKLTNKQISPDLLNEVVSLTTRPVTGKPNPKEVLEEAAKYFSVSITAVKGRSRKANLVKPRRLAMYLMRRDLKLPLAKIAELLNRSDHTGVIYSVNKTENELKQSSETREIVGEIRRRVHTRGGRVS
jgi:chromosomal replication initiator protein